MARPRSIRSFKAASIIPSSSSLELPPFALKRKRENSPPPVQSIPAPVKSVPPKTVTRSEQKVKNEVHTTDDTSLSSLTAKAKPSKSKKKSTDVASERRLRRFRKAPPKSFRERLNRALTQRMFVVGQTVAGTDEIPELKFDIVGTTGNIYTTFFRKEPSCNCPDAIKGNQCKHICYVLAKVLRAPEHLQYQLAFLSTEIREIYENSPLRNVKDKAEHHDTDGKRKAVEGDCPICFMEFEPDKENIVWCRAACGNNIHKSCFQQWASTQNDQGVRCVYCRSHWQNQDADGKVDISLEELIRDGKVGADGYINVASQMGLSGERDYSSYHQFWVRQHLSYSGWREENDY
ncbi:hypothetical protein BDW62DRAFT_140320 [Aspergillus aurantiobrunneus]